MNPLQDDVDSPTTDSLREAMIDELRQLDVVHSGHVLGAFRAVPRHLFAPETPFREVYAASLHPGQVRWHLPVRRQGRHRQPQQGRPGHYCVGAQQFGMEEPVNVIDEIPEPHRSTFVAVLEDKDPDLLQALRNSTLPTVAEWETVEETFIDALSEHYGPGHEPDEIGRRIDNALGAFMTRWPNDRLA